MIEIRTNRLIIRDYKADDLKAHHQLLSNKDVMYYLPGIMTRTEEESEQKLRQAIDAITKSPRELFSFFIEGQEGGVHVGEISYQVKARTPVGLHIEVSYFLRKEQQGKGYAAESLNALFGYIFRQGDVYRVSASCLTENAAAERVMQKVGMVKEGFLKDYTWHEGALKDQVCYGLLKEEWERGHSHL